MDSPIALIWIRPSFLLTDETLQKQLAASISTQVPKKVDVDWLYDGTVPLAHFIADKINPNLHIYQVSDRHFLRWLSYKFPVTIVGIVFTLVDPRYIFRRNLERSNLTVHDLLPAHIVRSQENREVLASSQRQEFSLRLKGIRANSSLPILVAAIQTELEHLDLHSLTGDAHLDQNELSFVHLQHLAQLIENIHVFVTRLSTTP
jgi:hypothetical protein